MNNNYVVVVSTNDNIEKVYLCNDYDCSILKMYNIVNELQNGEHENDFESLEILDTNKVIIKTAFTWYTISIKLVEK